MGMARSWLLDSRGLATKVKNATLPAASQIKDCGASRECSNCHYLIDNSDIAYEWPGLPIGVKFEPSDAELLEHLAAKCGVGNEKPHKLIDEFIPTLDGDEGIYYAHPENLPGAKKDGSSVHFFYRTMNAYATGKRKRRKIQAQNGLTMEQVRWHKTGKTKIVRENGTQKGCKKIMVLYSKGGSKPDKSNWVMHQYHLGSDKDEKEGEYVVSKIFYQQHNANDNTETSVKTEEHEACTFLASPRTPKTVIPIPPRPGVTPCDDFADDYVVDSSMQEVESVKEAIACSSDAQLKDELDYPTWLAGESQAPEVNDIEELLLCNEIIDSSTLSCGFGLNDGPFTGFTGNTNDVPLGAGQSTSGVAELENIEVDTPPDFQLADLHFDSQDSIFSWLDRL